ncbi:carbonyl reductase [NADPH] 1 [Erpetoichthys calabaricus]|uniref:carbonyl reductase (NADPH) n=1 Tax=Erpetoichthys calabaricus TaxID=27687 RepID=A0A8C4RKE9_ERPCA|nr:carbonyl reductase [NADPH] 1 [Erpetoichthys calabaricus]
MSCPKVAMVTGANKGIGLAIVRALCRQFAGHVYLTARDEGRGMAAVQTLENEGLSPHFHQLDITDLSSIRKIHDFMRDKYGGVDVLVNNAAVAFKVADTTPFGNQAEETLRTNFFATRDICREFLPIIKPSGRVVNIASIAGSMALRQCSQALKEKFRSEDITEEELVELMESFVEDAKKGVHTQKGWPNWAYGVSKIGVIVLSRIQAKEVSHKRGQDKILLNSCCPGWVKTDMAGPHATKTPDEGAITPVYLALLSEEDIEPHGQFVCEKKTQSW